MVAMVANTVGDLLEWLADLAAGSAVDSRGVAVATKGPEAWIYHDLS